MLESFEARVIPGPASTLEAQLPGAIAPITGAQMIPIGPQTWTGKSMMKSYGMTMVVTVRAAPVQGGTGVSLTIGAELDSTSLVVAILLLVLFWPAGVVVGYLGYDDFTKRRTFALQQIWQALGAAAYPSPYGVHVPPAPPAGFTGKFG